MGDHSALSMESGTQRSLPDALQIAGSNFAAGFLDQIAPARGLVSFQAEGFGLLVRSPQGKDLQLLRQ